MANEENLELITVIAQHKDEQKVVDAALKAGAPGITYFYGRGTGVRQRLGFLGNLIEEEKIVILMVVPPSKSLDVIKAVTQAAALDKPGNGFIFSQRVQNVVGFY